MTSNISRKPSAPTSALLQDMLREKKAHTSRVNKSYDIDEVQKNGMDDREVQSSPITSRERTGAPGRHVSGVGTRQVSIPKEMGMKELEQHLSKVNKQNFDLKLEVFHRRQRNEVLEAKLEKLESLEADNEEMQSINEELLLELEKRDVAIQEAVNLICELEVKIEEMGEAEMYFSNTPRTPITTATGLGIQEPDASEDDRCQGPSHRADPEPEAQAGESSPQAAPLSPPTANPARRIPSFLRDNKKSTNMLRSLYSNDESTDRPGSVFSGKDDEDDDDEDTHMLSSPRLSILSESGFMSIYGDTKDDDRISPRQTHASNNTADKPSPRDTQRDARLHKWVEERNRPTTPTRSSPKAALNDHFSSIGEVLEKVPSTTQESAVVEKDTPQHRDRKKRSPAKSERKEARGHQRRPSSPAFGGPMFGGATLPPTPSTMSTATIAGNSSTPSIVTEKSLLDGTPFPARGYSALIPDIRPRSSDSNFINRLSNGIAADDESDREREPESPSRNRSPKSTRIARLDAPTRPSLTTSATETVFSGEAYASTQPSRTLSYPSPTGRARRPSGQLSPTFEKSVGSVGEQERWSGRSATVTPTKGAAQESRTLSPTTRQETTTPIPGASIKQTEADQKLGRSASLRSKINKMSLTPNQPANKSVASRLFRRSNSQSIQAPSNAQGAIPSKSPMTREPSSSRQTGMLRASSLYGSSPIYAHPGTADRNENLAEKSSIPINPRRHSAILDNSANSTWKADQRADADSRQSVRPDDAKAKWGLGRNASAKIREGFGFKRSVSTQGV